MKSGMLVTVFLMLLNIWIISAEHQLIFTVQYAKSYRRDLLDEYMGCKQNSSIIYGTYLHPGGVKDALYVFLNQGVYQTRLSCSSQNHYVKIFGTQQNYEQLINSNPSSVANQVKQSLSRLNPNFIINWKCPLNLNTQKAKNWLHNFIQKLNTPSGKVYLKIPASYFCYQVNGAKYLDQIKTNKLIVQMYGQQTGVYTTYDDIFQKDTKQLESNQQNYSNDCPRFPSYPTLTKNYPQSQIFIEKTLQKQQAGFIGPRFFQYLQKGKQKYRKAVFFDSFPKQIIQI